MEKTPSHLKSTNKKHICEETDVKGIAYPLLIRKRQQLATKNQYPVNSKTPEKYLFPCTISHVRLYCWKALNIP